MPTEQKIRYSDCDPQGIVFNGNYARYWDDAATDWLAEAGFGGLELGGIGVDVVTARLEIDFKNSATMGDTLVTTPSVEQFGITSMMVQVVTTRAADNEVIAQGRMVWVFVGRDDLKPVPVPNVLKERLLDVG
jgi:acyl-CoA thioester hydrolase